MPLPKKPKPKPEMHMYRVINDTIGPKLGPHVVIVEGDYRFVNLTVEQADYYLEQGAIEPA